MEITEISKYTHSLTSSIFENLFQNHAKIKSTKKALKASEEGSYKRLETDSSEGENKHAKKSSVFIQTEDFSYFQEELAKKDLEIKNLKRTLLETQERLFKQAVSDSESPKNKELRKEAERLAERPDRVTRNKANVLDKAEIGLYFVEENNEVYVNEVESKAPRPVKETQKNPKNKERCLKDDKTKNEDISYKPSTPLNEVKTPKHAPRPFISKNNLPKPNETELKTSIEPKQHPNTLLKDPFSQPENPSNQFNKAYNVLSHYSIKSNLSSISSFRDLEAILSDPIDYPLIQKNTDLKKQSSFVNQAANTQIPETPKEPSNFHPVLHVTSEKPSFKRSRNSSLPWIEDLDSNPPQPKAKNSRPKTQEKQNIIKIPIKPASRLPASQAKTARFHSSQKTKPKKTGKKNLPQKDFLEDIIFSEKQDSESWAKLMSKFRKNPVIISRLLKSRGRPATQGKAENKPKSRRFEKLSQGENPKNKLEVESISTVIGTRPISLPEITPKPFSQHSKRVKDPDWSASVLDSYVSQNKKKFNFVGDEHVLSSQFIEDYIKKLQNRSIDEEEMKTVYFKALNTLGLLKTELMLPGFWVNIPGFCEGSLAQALSKCQKLLKARALTIKIIELVHFRESVLLDIMSSNKGKNRFSELESVNEELLQVLVFWKYMELPFTTFVYLGEDYYAKIHEDNQNLSSIFPTFQANDLFKEGLNESFNFDI